MKRLVNLRVVAKEGFGRVDRRRRNEAKIGKWFCEAILERWEEKAADWVFEFKLWFLFLL